jgi:acyl-CoA synthetase (AMP-forming)/AMP-acid ligase II
MRGYHNKAEITATAFRDGWFRTGDLGYIDSESYIYIVGRIKELIIRGGENISPAEVEEVLRRHPLVDDAACFALSDSKYGEEVGAAVVLKHGIAETNVHIASAGRALETAPAINAQTASDNVADEIKVHCGKHLNAIKVPKQIHFVDKIPRTSTNKVRRDVLAARFSQSLPEPHG